MAPESQPIEPGTWSSPGIAASGFPWNELVQRKIAALEEDRAERLRLILELEAKNSELVREVTELREKVIGAGATRDALVHEVLAYRREAMLPAWKRVYRRLVGRLPEPAPLPQAPATTSDAPAPAPPPANAAEVPETTTFRAMSTDRALWRIGRRGLDVGTVIDVGASNGMWSAVCERHLPKANYLLVEAQQCHEEALRQYCAARHNAAFVLAAAGPTDGTLWFDEGDPFSGLASTTQRPGMRRQLPAISIDSEIARRGLGGPYLLKLDVHGFEVPILEGAVETLRRASLVVIECYVFRLLDNSLLFDEMVRYMRERGFGVIDASEPLWRDRDASLWQFDLFFVPLSRREFASNTWS
ncbi:MAG: FkbM family methyltransferase [Phycisphaerae bacterium]|nr:FkbM family methyltransferase [Phycisphaerae bacterium]